MQPITVQLYTTDPTHIEEGQPVPATLNPAAVAVIVGPRKYAPLTRIYLLGGDHWNVADEYEDLAQRYGAALAGQDASAPPVYDGPTGPGGAVEDCQTKTCSYCSHYLVYGGPDLTHEGFHGAETQAAAHMASCTRDWSKGVCGVCTDWEKRVRA